MAPAAARARQQAEESRAKRSVTVVEIINHTGENRKAYTVEARFQRKLYGEEETQQYERQLTVKEEWQPFDLGWVGKPAMVFLKNEAGRGLRVIPSSQEKERIAARVIQVTFAALTESGPYFDVRPGESFRGSTSGADQLRIRCAKGEAKVTIGVIPE